MELSKGPAVSIVMCVYNGASFLEEQIESILTQSFYDFELLILDDKSSDSSETIIKAFAQKDPRIRYIRNDKNLGFNKNFEKGLSLASGELIAISDQDDIWMNDKIQRLVSNLTDHLLIYSNSSLVNEHGIPLEDRLDNRIKHVDNPSYKAFLDGNFITGHTCLFKRSLLQYVLPFPPQLFFYDWWLGFAASYNGKVKYLDEVLTQYRIHTSSVMQKIKGKDTSSNINLNKHLQLKAFAESKFLGARDKDFILKFLRLKASVGHSLYSFVSCYSFLLKHHNEIYPWYNKSALKKLNFLRKQCNK